MVDPDELNGTHLMCYKVRRATKFCQKSIPLSPVSCKNDEDCGSGDTCVREKKRHKKQQITVRNQFGEQPFKTIHEDELCVPSTQIMIP